MSDNLLQRSTAELVPDSVLDRMDRDGWTPTQVRVLIASYRALKRDVVELRDEHGIVGRGFVNVQKHSKRVLRHAFDLVEKKLRHAGVQLVDIRYYDMGASDTINMKRVGDQWTHGTLFDAFVAPPTSKGTEKVDG